MTWTYDPAIPDDMNHVRLLIGDTDTTDPLIQDQEIEFLLTDQGSVYRAAIAACKALAGKFARKFNYAYGPIREDKATLSKHFMDLAETLRKEMVRSGVMPYAGGLSIAEKQKWNTDDDIPQPFFYREQMTEPGTENTPPQFPTTVDFP